MLISMNDILQPTHEHRFAICAFNVADSCFLRAVVEEAEATSSPAIISIHSSEHDFVTDAFFAYVCEKDVKKPDAFCPAFGSRCFHRAYAKRYSVRIYVGHDRRLVAAL